MFIACAGMVRSGSTLQYNIVAEIVELKGVGQRLGWEHHEEFYKIKEKHKNDIYNVFKNHFLTNEIENELHLSDGSMLMYVYRDIRDVCVSIIDKENTTFENVLGSGVLHKAIEQYNKITTSPLKRYTRSYEVMFLNTKREIKELAKFLNIRLSEEELELIHCRISFDAQKTNIEKYKKNKDFVSTNNQKFNADSLLHLNHIKDGGVGKYKERLSQSQILRLENEFGDWLEKHGYELINQEKKPEPLRRYYSQHGQDYLIWKLFDFKASGFYIDIGAFDGKYISNTYSFEHNGWHGLCVEPIPQFYDLCKRNRPQSKCVNYALSATSEPSSLDFYVDETGLYSSYESSESSLEYIEKCHVNDNLKFKGLTKITVKNATLDSILEKEYDGSLPEIDFVSLDVEGAELLVLEGFDLVKYSPRVLVVEANNDDAKNSLINYMEKFGYIFTVQYMVDLFFTKSDFDFNRLRNIELNCTIEKQTHPIKESLSLQKLKYGVKYIKGVDSNTLVTNKDSLIIRKDAELKNKEQSIQNHIELLEKRDKDLLNQKAALKQKDERLEQQNVALKQKDERLEQQNVALKQKDERLEQQNVALKQKDERFEQQKIAIELKDKRITKLNLLLEQHKQSQVK